MHFSTSPLARMNFSSRADSSGPATSNASNTIVSTSCRSDALVRHVA